MHIRCDTSRGQLALLTTAGPGVGVAIALSSHSKRPSRAESGEQIQQKYLRNIRVIQSAQPWGDRNGRANVGKSVKK